MTYLIYILYFCALVGTRFDVAAGITMADFFCGGLAIICAFKFPAIISKKDIIAKYTFVYSILLLFSATINGNITNTVVLNFSRIFVEGLIVYASLIIAIKKAKDIKILSILIVLFSILYLFTSREQLNASMMQENNFALVDFGQGRNAFGVTNLLLSLIIVFIYFTKPFTLSKYCLLFIPFLIFNIIFSASRFSTLSMVIFAAFVLYWQRRSISFRNIFFILLACAAVYYIVPILTQSVDSTFMNTSTELLTNKLEKNEDGGFMYRLMDLNILWIADWLDETPFFMWLFGDGASITHGILSFTFCCTGLVGFIYFCYSNIKMAMKSYKSGFYGQYLCFVIGIYFLNDMVTNSRFIISQNTLIYMGILAYICSYIKIHSNENTNLSK